MKNKKKILLFLTLCVFLVILFLFSRLLSSKQESLENPRVFIVPEYQRTLEELVVTVPYLEKNEGETLELLKKHYKNLFLALPKYTKITVFTHQDSIIPIEKFLKNSNIQSSVRFHAVDNKNLELWAQDYFEPVVNLSASSEESSYLIPLTTNKNSAFKRISLRNDFLKELDLSLQAPFFFEGGNLTSATNDSGSFVFIDFEIIKKTRDLKKLLGKNLTELEIKQLFKNTFPSSKVVILGDKTRKDNFIHLDQSVLFLEDNMVIVNSFKGESETKAYKQHLLYEKQLSKHGFEVKHLPISIENVKESISYLNAIPFKDKETGQKKIIFPVYEKDLKNKDNKKTPLERDDLLDEGLEAFDLFDSIGYIPIPVFDNITFKQNGSLHCISNVLK